VLGVGLVVLALGLALWLAALVALYGWLLMVAGAALIVAACTQRYSSL
jgi:uncharacterized membrane protein HdeD (DUF308 family)